MKKLLFATIFLILPAVSHASGAFVYSASTIPVAVSFTQTINDGNAQAGNLLVITVHGGTTGRTNVLDVTRSPTGLGATTTESCALATSTAGTIQPTIWVYTCPNITGGYTHASSTISGASASNRIFITEFSGAVLTNPVDNVAASSTNQLNDNVRTNIATTSQAGPEILYMVAGCNTICTFTANNGFTTLEIGSRGGNAYQIVASSTPIGLATLSGGNFTWAAILVDIKLVPPPSAPTSYLDLEVQAFINGFLSI